MESPVRRLQILKDRCKKYPYEKSAKKLSNLEFDLILKFIEKNDNLGYLEFEYAVNRMFLDREKPKNWPIIQELLVVANSATLLKI
jgi:hypothetical protein